MFDAGTVLAAALAGPHIPCSRLVVLSGIDGDVLASWEGGTGILESAVVGFDRSRQVRRSVDITLVDHDGALSPQRPGDLFFPGAFLRLDRGAIIAGQRTYLPLGTFVVTSFQSAMMGRIAVHGEDPFHLLAQPFGEVVTVAAGTPATDALRTLWEPVLGDSTTWPLDGDGRVVASRSFLEDEDRLGAAVAWMADLGLEVYADRLGRPTLAPVVDPSETATAAAVRDFRSDADQVLLSLDRSGDRLPYNRVIVETMPTDGAEPERAVAAVTDPSSPIHADRIGTQTAPLYRSAQVTDRAAAFAVARALLVEYSLISDVVRGSAVPDPTLDESDVVTISEPISGTNDRYRIERLTHPVTPGAMSIEATKVLPLFLLGAS